MSNSAFKARVRVKAIDEVPPVLSTTVALGCSRGKIFGMLDWYVLLGYHM